MKLRDFCKRAFIFLFGKGSLYDFLYRVRHGIKYESNGDFIVVKQRGQPDILRPKKSNDFSIKLPLDFNFKNNPVRIAAVVHIFYIEMAEEIKNFLYNIPAPFDVYISTNDENKKSALEKIFCNFERGKIEIRVFENRGRDIAPAFVGFRNVYKNYDICVHIHSKKSPHDPQLEHWGKYLYKSLLGSREIVSGILHILEFENVGVVFPQYFEPLMRNINFGKNYFDAQKILSRLNIQIDNTKIFEFPASSMFWFKPKALSPIFESDLKFEDFPEEYGQLDGTTAHAIERIFLYVASNCGFSFVKVTADEKAVGKVPVLYSKNDAEFAANVKKILKINSGEL